MSPPRGDRRKAILDTAEEAFADHGFNGVGMREIAARVGLHSATLYHYFSGKEQLFFAVIDRVFKEAHQWIHQALTFPTEGQGKLILFIEKQFDFLASHRNYFRIILHERLCQSPRLEEVAARFVRPLLDSLVPLLEEMAREGTIRPVDSRLVLFQMMSLNAAHLVFAPLLRQVMKLGDEANAQFLSKLKRSNVELLLHGLTSS